MNKIQKNQVRLYSIFFINAIYDVLFFLHPYSSFHPHWSCLVLIFITAYSHYTVDFYSVFPSLIRLPSHPSMPTDVKLIFLKHVSGHTTLLQIFCWFPFADRINDELISSWPFRVWCPPTSPLFFLISFFHLPYCLPFLLTWHWSGSLPIQPSLKTPPSTPTQNVAPDAHWTESFLGVRSSSDPLLPWKLLWFSPPLLWETNFLFSQLLSYFRVCSLKAWTPFLPRFWIIYMLTSPPPGDF